MFSKPKGLTSQNSKTFVTWSENERKANVRNHNIKSKHQENWGEKLKKKIESLILTVCPSNSVAQLLSQKKKKPSRICTTHNAKEGGTQLMNKGQ